MLMAACKLADLPLVMVIVPVNTAVAEVTTFCVIVIEDVDVTPPLVTVTVYVPGVVTVSPADVPTTVEALDHEYVPPPVEVKLIDVVVQFNSVVPVLLVIAVTGGVDVCVMVIDVVAEQPLALVTVTV
jgi:hypothetical protein